MNWYLSNRADPNAKVLADKHYNRQKPWTKQFVPPGACLVLLAGLPKANALWVSTWPKAEFVQHAWAGAWVCNIFRNESNLLASHLILEAISATRYTWPDIPSLGMITFIDTRFVKPIYRRSKPTWGYTWLKAGFIYVGQTKKGLLAFQLTPDKMPPATPFKTKWRLELESRHALATLESRSS